MQLCIFQNPQHFLRSTIWGEIILIMSFKSLFPEVVEYGHPVFLSHIAMELK